MDAILESMPDGKSVYSRDLVEEVSQLSEKGVSSVRIGQHMAMLEDEGKVMRVDTGAKRMWMKVVKMRRTTESVK